MNQWQRNVHPASHSLGDIEETRNDDVQANNDNEDGGIQDHQSEPDDSGEGGSTNHEENTNESSANSEDDGSVVERSEDVGGDSERQTNVDSNGESSHGIIGYVSQCDQPLLEKFMKGEFGGEEVQEVNGDDDGEHQNQTEAENGSFAEI